MPDELRPGTTMPVIWMNHEHGNEPIAVERVFQHTVADHLFIGDAYKTSAISYRVPDEGPAAIVVPCDVVE